MATQLDFQEQEQIDQLKAFWKTYGNLITGVLTLALLGFAAWNGYHWWMRDQSAKAGALYDELERVASEGDAEKTARVFSDMKDRYGRTAYAQQAALVAAKVQIEKKQPDAALAALNWAAEKATDDEYRTMARLRAAGVLLDEKRYDEALKQLDGATAKHYAGLVADRRGDVLLAQGKTDEAKAAFRQAYDALEAAPDFRRLVEAKLTVLGAAPGESKDAKDKAAQ